MNLDVKELIVKYNNRIVGYLKQIDKYKTAFQYDKDWIKTGFCISPFSLPLRDEVFVCDSYDFYGLFEVFYDSLPDGWGKGMISLALTKKKIEYAKLSALTKLALLPNNGLGGLTYHPSLSKTNEANKVDFDQIQKEINGILANTINLDNIDDVLNMGSASGGGRPKVHVKIDNKHYIVKYKYKSDPDNIGFLEYQYNLLAKQCGINTNDFILIKSNVTPGYFAALRFDINQAKKVHVISFASILEQSLRYANLDYFQLAQVINAICVNPAKDLLEAYKRLVFNVLIENKDDHEKTLHLFIVKKKADTNYHLFMTLLLHQTRKNTN